MKLLLAVVLIPFAAAAADPSAVDRFGSGIAGAIDELSLQLFLHEADSAYEEGQYVEARDRYAWLAERGSADAQLALGVMYEEGRGVLHDYGDAYRWYLEAARQGLAPAQVRLARMYLLGRHVRADNLLAYAWASVAADQGDETAAGSLDAIARLLNDHQLESARSLAAEWIARYNDP